MTMHAKAKSCVAGLAALLTMLSVLSVQAQAPAQPPPIGTFEQEYQRYLSYQSRPSLYLRSRVYDRLAQTKHKQALEVLAKLYDQPSAPKHEKSNPVEPDHIRYIVAGICGQRFAAPEFADQMTRWAERNTSSEHAWLWYNSLMVQAQHKGPEGVATVAKDSAKPLFVRAAALEALANAQASGIAATVISVLGDKPPTTAFDRAVLATSCAAALAKANDVLSEEGKRAAGLVIDQLDEKGIDDRYKVTIARYLSKLFNEDNLFINGDPWRKKLGTASSGGGEGRTRPRTQFIGLEGSGTRFVYLIDLSDSMMAPLKDEEKKELRKRVITGRGASDREEKKKEKEDEKKGGNADPENLPWKQIKTRFDAAREFLKASLDGLAESNTKEMPLSFTVIVFGTKAELLLPDMGIAPASKANVGKAKKALDAIKGGPPIQDRPHGVLKGNTNLHGALLKGYQVTGNKILPRMEHVDAAGFENGGDTIFILSDGAPSWDDFDGIDKRDPDIQCGDPESHTKAANVDNVHYYGPYVEVIEPNYLVRDVRRMNLFRKCEINCIAIGEASPWLLQQIAEIGMGKLRCIGTGK